MNGKPAAHHHLRSPARRAVAAQLQEHNQETEVRFYLCDHLGTPNALLSQSGEIDWAAQLDAWGNVTQEYNPHGLYAGAAPRPGHGAVLQPVSVLRAEVGVVYQSGSDWFERWL